MGRKKKKNRKRGAANGRSIVNDSSTRNRSSSSYQDSLGGCAGQELDLGKDDSERHSNTSLSSTELCASLRDNVGIADKEGDATPHFTLDSEDESTKTSSRSTSPENDLSGKSSARSSSSAIHITAKHVIVGDGGTINDYSGTTSADNLENVRLSRDSSAGSALGKSHAAVAQCTQTESDTDLNIEPIGQEPGPDLSTRAISIFSKSVQNFSRGHYILLVGKLRTNEIPNIDLITLAPWSVVFDLDPESRHSGLLSYAEHFVSKRKSLHIVTWQDMDKCNINENSIYWVGMNGWSDRPSTRTNGDFRKWKTSIKSNFTQMLEQLKKFGNNYTEFTVVALWLNDYTEILCIRYMLVELGDSLLPKIVLVDENKIKKTDDIEVVFRDTIKHHELDICVIEITFDDVCKAVGILYKPLSSTNSSNYQLPTSDSTNSTNITEANAQWLKEDLDVLYINNTTGKDYTQEELEKEEDTFFKGGALPWSWWYTVGAGQVDVERDITTDVRDLILKRHIETCRPGCITLLHNPGSGGTTLSQRIVWMLREKVPCVQVKHRHGLSITDLTEKINFLATKRIFQYFFL